MDKKIIARQVPPEWQESPLFHDESAFYDVLVYGNRDYNTHAHGIFKDIDGRIQDIAEEYDNYKRGCYQYCFGTWEESTNKLAPHVDGRDYTRAERVEWARIARAWLYEEDNDKIDQLILDALRLMTGTKYAKDTLRGCTQREWHYIIYPADRGREWVRTFETEYFNNGTEWDVDEGDGETYSVYCTTYTPQKEIAGIIGTAPENITLYEFDGWERTPKYKGVGA